MVRPFRPTLGPLQRPSAVVSRGVEGVDPHAWGSAYDPRTWPTGRAHGSTTVQRPFTRRSIAPGTDDNVMWSMLTLAAGFGVAYRQRLGGGPHEEHIIDEIEAERRSG